MDNGAEASVTPTGGIVIRVGGRSVFATAAGELARANRYETSFQQGVGFYEFVRGVETRVAFDTVVRREVVGGGIDVDLAAGDDGTATATVRIEAGPIPNSTRIRFEVTGVVDHASTSIPLQCDAQASFLGFGEQYNAIDQRGEAFALWSQEQGIGRGGNLWLVEGDAHTTYAPMPYFMDARGFGLVVQTTARVLVDLCQTDAQVAWIEVERAQPVDFVVLHGPTPADVVRELGDLYGRPHAIPDWALGPWIGIQGGDQVVRDESAALDAAQVPYTALWAQDWLGRRSFTSDQVGVKYHWNVDPTLYPDLGGLISDLHAHDPPVRFLGYANPWVVQPQEHYAPMDAMGMLIRDSGGATYVMSTASLEDGSLPDLTNAATRAYVGGFLDSMASLGMDGWMCDFGEALPVDSYLSDGSTGWLAHNAYPEAWHSLNRERLESARPTGDFALFSRSGWLGMQGSAQIVWVGDQEADFSLTDGLPTVIPALLNLGLSGVPFTTLDIAGFSGGPSTEEVYERWVELGAFSLIMRTHEGLKRALNWNWNGGPNATQAEIDRTVAHFRRFARIHEALVPTLHALVAEAATTSMPPVRHLVLVFPDDPNVVAIADQFMIGDDLLVAPVVTGGVSERQVYLPNGSWFDVWTGVEYQGGRSLMVAAPIGSPPVFSRGADRSDLRAIPQ